MKPIAVLNDNHIGTLRSAGTTVQSAIALRKFGINSFGYLLEGIDTDLAVNGDLFDSFQIPLIDAFEVQTLLASWLKKGHKLWLICGNHDLSTDSSKLSTFEYMSRTLASVFPDQVTFLRGAGWLVEGKVYAISHVPNQDLFDLELSRVPECDYLLLHCNWDNGFAKESDHSLNLSLEVARNLPAKSIVLGHEHSWNSHLQGRVVIPGVQYPMSISDCLDGKDKFRVVLAGEGKVEAVKTWDVKHYVEADWRELSTNDAPFVRVVGTATQEEASDVIETIAKFRRVSDAFIVGSAVKIDGQEASADIDAALASVEDVRAFDVIGTLKGLLKEDQVKKLETLK